MRHRLWVSDWKATRAAVLSVFLIALLCLGQRAAAQSSFAPGARELLSLNLAAGSPGQIPGGLSLLNGSLDVVNKDGGRMLRATTPSEFLIALPEVLPADFTIEFDLVPKPCGCGNMDLEFDGTSGTWSGTSARVQWSPGNHGVSGGGPSPFTMTTPTLAETAPGQLTRIIASFEGSTLKLYTNGQRLYTLSGRVFARGQVLRVRLGGQDEEQAVYLARLRVAAGAGSMVAAAPASALPAAQTGTIVPIAPPPPPPPPTLPGGQVTGATGTPSSTGNPATDTKAALLVGPAPTSLKVTVWTPLSSSLSWTAASGATGYTVNRAPAGTTTWTQLTQSPISATHIDQVVLPDGASLQNAYTYQVVAHQPDGRIGAATVDFTPLLPRDPSGFTARIVGVGVVELTWEGIPPPGSDGNYLVSGPGIPQGARAPHWDRVRDVYMSYRVTGVPAGTHEYRIATVYSPGGVLTPASSWPKATVRMAPASSVPLLSMGNGAGTPAEYNLHTCHAGKWLATQMVFLNDWCSVPTGSIYARPFAFPLLSLFDIYEKVPRFDEEGWWPNEINRIAPVSEQSSFRWQWLRNGFTIPSAIFTDAADLGRSREVACLTRGAGAQATVMCWGHSGVVPTYGGSGQGQTLSVIVQTWTETHFLTFNNDIHIDPTCVGSECRALPGLGAITLDNQGKKHLPHACMACHGGRFDPQTGKVTGASLLPLDPRGFTFPPVQADLQLVPNSRSSKEEVIRQINLMIFNSNASVGVRQYINDMYGGRFAVIGATVQDDLVPLGWKEQPALYRDVYRPYCALCHSAQNGLLGFTGWADLVREKGRVKRAICEGTMPHAEVPLLRFWNDGAPAIARPTELLAALGYSGC